MIYLRMTSITRSSGYWTTIGRCISYRAAGRLFFYEFSDNYCTYIAIEPTGFFQMLMEDEFHAEYEVMDEKVDIDDISAGAKAKVQNAFAEFRDTFRTEASVE